MLPLGRQQARSAAKMQELAPEMKRIAEQYKNDMEKRAAAQRELFRTHNYNPLSGCLLMFIQLPIFVGLYRALSVDIELRQAPLIPGLRWCSNLAGPDKLLYWGDWAFLPDFLVGPTGYLGPYLNLLPLISIVLFLIQQKLFTPPPTDEQQVIQQKMMKFMTIFIGVLFFKVPAGLCLYFIASGLWSIGERKTLGHTATKPAEAKGRPEATKGMSKVRSSVEESMRQLLGKKPSGGNGAARAARRKKVRRKP
jgi:YidC/Oxa1 family membrane protein insertase